MEECIRIVKATREASPGIIINGRAISGFDRYDYYNTSDCPYEFSNYGDIYWEGIPTTNNSYAYNENDNEYKPASFFIKLLVKAAARNGNILMNIGPMGNGKFSSPDKTILKGIADWWEVNGESSIRGTKATPLESSRGERLPGKAINSICTYSTGLKTESCVSAGCLQM